MGKCKNYFGTFNNPKDVIGPIGDKPYPPLPPKAPPKNIHVDDEGARVDPEFKPYGTNTKRNDLHDTFDRFPGGNKGAINVTKRKPPPADDAPPPFRMTHNGKKPLPFRSIQTNTRNLKSSYPQFFRK